MSYLALYRKWRPKTFSEVIGQDAIMKALRNQIRSGHIGHAYLFCGTRGCGKTSTAKIMARAVNCLHPVDGNPCNECELCLQGESDFNIIEIDAASNNGVDNIRDLRDEVRYAPARGRYKVYIIDEVHMLSASAFNALLKTLEEPPEHVIFILATTEPHKILPTILSRCQRYDFRRISVRDLTAQLTRISQEEGIEADPDALSYIADAADGGSRDALSILDQCASFYMDEHLTLEKVLRVLGATDHTVFTRATQILLSRNQTAMLRELEELFASGRDTSRFLLDWISYLRNVLLLQLMGDEALAFIPVPASELQDLQTISRSIGPDTITYYVEELAKLELSLRNAAEKRVLLEAGALKLCRNRENVPQAVLARLETLERTISSGVSLVSERPSAAAAAPSAAPSQAAPAPAPAFTPAEAPAEQPHPAKSTKATRSLTKDQWQMVIQRVIEKSGRPGLGAMFAFVKPIFENGQLVLVAKDTAYKMRIQGGNLMPLIKTETGLMLGQEIPVVLYDQKEYDGHNAISAPAEKADLLSRIGGPKRFE